MSTTEHLGYWERGAAVLRSLGYPEAYGCPICLRLFRRDQIDQLSLDHVPPKSVGSKLKVLTCKACNSTAGNELDAHAYQFDVFRRIVAGEPYPAVSARLTVNAGYLSDAVGPINVELRSDGAINDIIGLPGCNPDGTLDQLRAVFERYAHAGTTPPEMNFALPTLRPFQHRARVSYLRAGYLAAFAVFGYDLIARRSFDRVRAQIREPEVEHVPQFFYRHDDLYGYEIAAVEEPAWHSSIVVLMGRYRITLPLLNDADIYERLAEKAAVGGQWTLRCGRWNWPKYPKYMLDLAKSRSGQDASGEPR
jgi:HNH endonuclease